MKSEKAVDSPQDMDELIMRILRGEDLRSFAALNEAMLLKKPLSGRTLKVVAETLPQKLVVETLDISPSHLSKQYAGTLSRTQTEQISSLTFLWAELREFFDSDLEILNSWLDDFIPVLGETPRNLISTFAGRRVIEDFMNRIRYGDCSL